MSIFVPVKTLDGKRILITGASRGLGRQLAADFALAGAASLALTAGNYTRGPSSHLELLCAFLPEAQLRAAYAEALREKY